MRMIWHARFHLLSLPFFKLFVSGAGNSGKTTLLRQLRIIYGRPWSAEEKKTDLQIMLENAIESMKSIVSNGFRTIGNQSVAPELQVQIAWCYDENHLWCFNPKRCCFNSERQCDDHDARALLKFCRQKLSRFWNLRRVRVEATIWPAKWSTPSRACGKRKSYRKPSAIVLTTSSATLLSSELRSLSAACCRFLVLSFFSSASRDVHVSTCPVSWINLKDCLRVIIFQTSRICSGCKPQQPKSTSRLTKFMMQIARKLWFHRTTCIRYTIPSSPYLVLLLLQVCGCWRSVAWAQEVDQLLRRRGDSDIYGGYQRIRPAFNGKRKIQSVARDTEYLRVNRQFQVRCCNLLMIYLNVVYMPLTPSV